MNRAPFDLPTLCGSVNLDMIGDCNWTPSGNGSRITCDPYTAFNESSYIPQDLPFCAVPPFTSPVFVPRELEPVGPDMFLPDVFNCVTVKPADQASGPKVFSSRPTMRLEAVGSGCDSPVLEFDFNIPCLPLEVSAHAALIFCTHDELHAKAEMVRSSGGCRLDINLTLFLAPRASGFTGPMGLTGPSGLLGPAGMDGAAGSPGAAGAAGDKGETGPSGDKGAGGPRGPRGYSGHTGSTGDKGTRGSGVGYRGPRGHSGHTGHTGDKGRTGGSVGSVGDQGPMGSMGVTGPMGISVGPTGPYVTLLSGLNGWKGKTGPSCHSGGAGHGTGSQGPGGECPKSCMDGLKGPVGTKGFPGDQGYDGTIGIRGIANHSVGPTGPVGDQGLPGWAYKLPNIQNQVDYLANMLAGCGCVPALSLQHIGAAQENDVNVKSFRTAQDAGTRFYYNSRRVSFDVSVTDIVALTPGLDALRQVNIGIEQNSTCYHVAIQKGAIVRWDIIMP